MNTPIMTRLLAAAGVLAGVCYFLGGHVVQPSSGDPSQRMTDSEIVDWAHDSYGALWAGGIVSMVGALLLLVWGVAVAERVAASTPDRLTGPIARASVLVASSALAIAGVCQVFTGTASMPGEHLESESFIPVLAILYGNLAASAWCLLAPAAAGVAMAGSFPRWTRVTSGVLAALLLACFALPPVSWPFGLLWAFTTSAGLAATDARRAVSPIAADSLGR